MDNNLKNELKEKFNKIYGEGFRLLAIHLDGFSHSVFYDEGNAESKVQIERFSACAPEIAWDERAQKLLENVPHHVYQGNAQELLYVHPNER